MTAKEKRAKEDGWEPDRYWEGNPLHIPPLAIFLNILFDLIGIISLLTFLNYQEKPISDTTVLKGIGILLGFVIIGFYFLFFMKVANQWEKGVILRLGKFRGVYGPGFFFLIPFVDTVASWVDMRIRTTSFLAEQTLTEDTVPVDVDAVLFWVVWDAKKATLEVESYATAVSWAAQTALRDIIGKTELGPLLKGRDEIDQALQKTIDQKTEPWGITVQAVEIRDIMIPSALQDAMSREAQAERERRARVILGDSERQIAGKFAEAAQAYINNPTALHLRAMNMLYEGVKERGSLIIVPSSALDTMNLGGIAGIAALGKTPGIQEPPPPAVTPLKPSDEMPSIG